MTRVGWCPGVRTVADMLAMYPGTQVVRIFVGPQKPLPAWDGPVLGPLVAAGVVVHLSFKTNPTAEVTAWAAKKPRGVLLLLTADHEPEQGTTAGDPTVEQFHAGWGELVPAFDGHPMRYEILLGPVYTRFWWQAHPGDMRWLVKVPVDFIGWDVYNNGATYRTPDDLLTIPRQIAAKTGLPYLIPELGAIRLSADRDGSGRQAWMRAMVAAADADGAWCACWFHKDEWDLSGPGSVPEQQTWRDIIKEAPVAWIKGQPWRVVRSLDRLDAQIRAAYPQAVPPATPATAWGSIADSAHSTTSDHYPHYYSALGGTAVVCARDFPHAPDVGLDAHALADRLRQSHDSRIGYIISNRRITGAQHDWQWAPYSGSDPHDTHIHVSTVHTAAADNTSDWQITEGDEFVTSKDEFLAIVRDPAVADALFDAVVKRDRLTNVYADYKTNATTMLMSAVNTISRDSGRAANGVEKMAVELAALRSVVDSLTKAVSTSGGSVDTAAVLAGVDRAVDAAVQTLKAETRDAVADLGEGGAAQVRGQQA